MTILEIALGVAAGLVLFHVLRVLFWVIVS